MKKIGIFGKFLAESSIEPIQSLLTQLCDKCEVLTIYQPFFDHIKDRVTLEKSIQTFDKHEEIKGKIDCLFSIGGDGTFLDTITLIRDSNIPIMGINTGRLGFLSSIAKEEISDALSKLFNDEFALDHRTLISLESNKSIFKNVDYALNEFTVHKKDTSSMITIKTYLNGDFLNAYWADGLIISTPTGSTGYSLSCGGPIVFPQSGNFVITPIASHNLNNRPIVFSDQNIVSIEIEGRSDNFLATLDSRSETIDNTYKLTIKKASFDIKIIRLSNQNFTNTLRNKLMWGLDKRN
ncbi:MAG: NAD kinase [Bacteroidia bacterium]|nr:NAD kinase [Bacteroidia bacterium]